MSKTNSFNSILDNWKSSLPDEPVVAPRISRPNGLPDWVWTQFNIELQSWRCREEIYLTCLERLVGEADPKHTWSALERRRDDYNAHWAAQELRPEPELHAIVSAIHSVLTGFKGHHLFTKKQRQKSGKSIATSATALAAELRLLVEGNSNLPSVFVERLGGGGALESVSDHLVAVLDDLAEAGKVWANSRPLISKPSLGNVPRTVLVQVLTQHFQSIYQTPLRKTTLSIVSVFFDCSGMTESDVARLAPVPKS